MSPLHGQGYGTIGHRIALIEEGWKYETRDWPEGLASYEVLAKEVVLGGEWDQNRMLNSVTVSVDGVDFMPFAKGDGFDQSRLRDFYKVVMLLRVKEQDHAVAVPLGLLRDVQETCTGMAVSASLKDVDLMLHKIEERHLNEESPSPYLDAEQLRRLKARTEAGPTHLFAEPPRTLGRAFVLECVERPAIPERLAYVNDLLAERRALLPVGGEWVLEEMERCPGTRFDSDVYAIAATLMLDVDAQALDAWAMTREGYDALRISMAEKVRTGYYGGDFDWHEGVKDAQYQHYEAELCTHVEEIKECMALASMEKKGYVAVNELAFSRVLSPALRECETAAHVLRAVDVWTMDDSQTYEHLEARDAWTRDDALAYCQGKKKPNQGPKAVPAKAVERQTPAQVEECVRRQAAEVKCRVRSGAKDKSR